LVLKIVGIVEIYLLNTYKFFPTFFATYNLKFFEIVAWEHEMGGIIGNFPIPGADEDGMALGALWAGDRRSRLFRRGSPGLR
jgi:hypothetical protein